MQQDTLRQVGPLLVSILILVVLTILRNYSRVLSAVLVTTSVVIPLSLWIIYTGVGGDRASIRQFTDALPIGVVGTVAFIVAIWFASRAGWRLLPMIGAGYAAWAAALALLFALRGLLGH
jgi:hypothetical protein